MNNEFLLNKKDIPTADSAEYDDFWAEEHNKVRYGLDVHGVHVPGWLYWHTQLWYIYQNIEDKLNFSIRRVSKQASMRDNEWMIAEAIERAEKERKGVMLFGSRRLGKELADYEPVITPTGEVPIGSIKQGDTVYGRNGKKTTVTDVFPQGVKPIYRMHFLDGRFIDAGLDHQWVFERVQGRGINKKRVEIVKTTKELLNLTLKSSCKNGGYTYSYYLPQNKPVEFDYKELKITPYLMGLLLGDGSMQHQTPIVSTDDDEIEKFIKEELGPNYEITYDKSDIKNHGRPIKRLIKYIGKDKYTKTEYDNYKSGVNPISREILNLNLRKNCYEKFIPDLYKYSSIEQRFELLRGLMDSDGSISESGSCEFAANNEILAKDVLWLVRSLGIRCQLAHEPKREVTKVMPGGITRTFETEKWRVHIRTDLPIFKLTRKLNRLKSRKNTSSVALDRIEYLGDFSATCITVDNDEHLFLTKDFIVTHNSEIIASYLAQGATLHEGSENVILGGNWGDIDVVMSKVIHGLNELPQYFKFGKLKEDLRKEIELGFKIKNTGNSYDRQSWSKIICRNHENGNNTEAPAGLTPTRFVIDEIAKSRFSEVLEAAKPAFTSEFGWRCSPILTGTAGDIKSVADAQAYFENPESNNFIAVVLPEEGNKKTSVFISGLYRMEGKVNSNLGTFLENEKGILLKEKDELFDIPMQVTDKDKALAIITEERRLAELSPDPTALLKQKMYYPLNTTELFLTDDGNNFPKEVMMEQIEFLKANPELQGKAVDLYRNLEGKVEYKPSQKKAILEFPLDKSKFLAYKKDTPVILYELPPDNPTSFLYLSGLDSYNLSSSVWSDSLGSIFIFKRFYDPLGGSYQRRIVAEYTGRPADMKIFHETCVMLLELYNATCMMENAATGTLQYFDLSQKNHLLADGFSLLKEIHPTTSIVSKAKGLPATKPVQRHYKELIYEYLTEEIVIDFDKDHNPIKKLGAVRIPSIGLLLELIGYNDEGNFDRYVAFGHALTYEAWADKMYPIGRVNTTYTDSFYVEPNTKNPFVLQGGNIFGGRSKNPFAN